jgi:hypothetical protein
MKRRLYYLLPDTSHAEKLVEDLGDTAISKQDVHAVVKDNLRLNGIDDVHAATENDRDYFVEWFLWRINLALFFVALIAFVAIFIWSPGGWLILPLAIMIGTFVSGLMFVLRLPNVHLNEFHPALQHGEVLLMIDVPPSVVEEVDHCVHRKHPEVVTGGVCWHV